MRYLTTFLFIFFACISFAQKWNPTHKKGGLYFFSTYYADSTCKEALNGTLEETIGNERAIREFKNGHLIREKKWHLKTQTHDYHIIQSKPFSALYLVWDSLGRINERWKISETENQRRQLDITVFYSNGKKLVEYSYVQLTAEEFKKNFPDSLSDQQIDDQGFSPALVPVGKSLEWSENGTLISQKEYSFDPRPIAEEDRRSGKYIHNYPNGSPWEQIEYPENNPYRKLYPYKKFYDNGKTMAELSFLPNGKAVKKEYTTTGELSLVQLITNYNQIPNQNRTQWYSYNGLCYRMRDEDPLADTIEFERNLPTRFTYLHLKKNDITTIIKNDPNGLQVEKTTIYPDSTKKIEKYKAGKLIKIIEQKDNFEKIKEFTSDSLIWNYQRIDGIIQGEFVCTENETEVQRLHYIDGISFNHLSEITYTKDSLNSVDSLYQNAYRRKSYYPFTICTADTSGLYHHTKSALGQFEMDWNNNIGYPWNHVVQEIPIAEISWARGKSFTMIEIIETLRAPAYIIYYDDGYIEFLNREVDWTDLVPVLLNFKLNLFDQD
jgi:hypothetical protein